MSDHDDLIRLQQQVVTLERQVEDLKRKQTELTELANKGRGALWMLVKIGAVVSVVGGLLYAAWRAVTGH